MVRRQLLLVFLGIALWASVAPVYAGEQSNVQELDAGNAAIQAVGGLAASNIYLTYLSMGSVYDNYTTGVYDSQTSRNLVLSLQELIDASVRHIENVRENEVLSQQDEEFLTSMIEAYGLLQKQSAFFLRYIKTGAAKERENFQKERTAAWKKISDILGIE